MITVCIGDVHGCLDELKELLSKLESRKLLIAGNRLIFLGDLLDRGPDSVGCVRLVKSLCDAGKAECVLGNHENKHVRYRRHEMQFGLTGKKNPMKRMTPTDLAAQKGLTEDEIAWLRNLPLTIPIHNHWVALHGGLEPRYDLKHQDPNQIIRCRYVKSDNGKAVALAKDMTQPEGTVYWTEAWKGPESIVYGHCVHSLKHPRVDSCPLYRYNDGQLQSVKCIGIDTGAVFGGRLTALVLEWKPSITQPYMEFIQVDAKKDYAHLSAQFEE